MPSYHLSPEKIIDTIVSQVHATLNKTKWENVRKKVLLVETFQFQTENH